MSFVEWRQTMETELTSKLSLWWSFLFQVFFCWWKFFHKFVFWSGQSRKAGFSHLFHLYRFGNSNGNPLLVTHVEHGLGAPWPFKHNLLCLGFYLFSLYYFHRRCCEFGPKPINFMRFITIAANLTVTGSFGHRRHNVYTSYSLKLRWLNYAGPF